MNDFTILVAPDALATSVSVTLDLLSTAATMAPRVGAVTPRWKVVSLSEGMTPLSNGMYIDAKPLPRRAKADQSIWVVPGLATRTPRAVDSRLIQPDAQRAIHALKVHARAGGTIAASCSGVFLLQAAELLKKRKVTTTWWLASHLQNLEPECIVDANRLVISDGKIWTAGAAFAQTDLMLRLIQDRFGNALAEAVSRVMVVDGREAQAPYVVPAMLANGNELISTLSLQIEKSLPAAASVKDMAEKLCISEKTLGRRIKAATGKSTSELIQLVRLKSARRLLETTNMPVDVIAEKVGYSDATALRRLMRKTFNTTPRQFRTNRGNM